MRTSTIWRCLAFVLLSAGLTGSAFSQTRNVTLTLNMATVPDTINVNDMIQVRGAVDGTDSTNNLPGGQTISWDSRSTLNTTNVGGDYYQMSFDILQSSDLTFKFYSQQTEDAGLNGWEADPNPMLGPGTNDTTFAVHYFEQGSDKGPYLWRPFDSKPDSVGIWFRVFMCTEHGLERTYDPNNAQIGVRGSDYGGLSPLDWGATNVMLTRESDVSGTAASDLWSGLAYFPSTLIDSTIAYKFFVEPDGWEDGNLTDDRKFVLPAQDSTLHWDYFGKTAGATCGASPVATDVIFAVDTTPLEDMGIFDVTRGDTLEIRGAFNGWDCDNPDDCLLQRVPGTREYEAAIPFNALPDTRQDYKFFINFNDVEFMNAFGKEPPGGWEEPISTAGANRAFTYAGNAGQDQVLDIFRFNDVLEGNIIPLGTTTDVTLTVDMTPALSATEPFIPATDSVFIVVGDPIWSFTQGVTEPSNDDGTLYYGFPFTDTGNNIYSATIPVSGPGYGAIQYRYYFADRTAAGGRYLAEAGGGTGGQGRRRIRFITPNPDGSWPATWTFPTETFQEQGALPSESNPVATSVEPVGGELPTQIALSQNFPNPFNPTTSFEYTVNASQHVRLAVYDLLGRQVATIVDGVQPANTYLVKFDAERLASGTYIYRLETEKSVVSKTMVLLK